MKNILSATGILLLLCACHDMNKQQQLGRVSEMIQRIDSLKNAVAHISQDSVQLAISGVSEAESRFREIYRSDTLELETARKIDAFRKIRKELEPLSDVLPQVGPELEKERDALQKLRGDIRNATGNRDKYDEYLLFEQNKVNELNVLIHELIETETNCLYSYRELRPGIETLLQPSSKK